MGHDATKSYALKVDLKDVEEKKKVLFNRNIHNYSDE